MMSQLFDHSIGQWQLHNNSDAETKMFSPKFSFNIIKLISKHKIPDLYWLIRNPLIDPYASQNTKNFIYLFIFA
jgi:hypothetical protein